VSGAQFNPAVTLVMLLRGEIDSRMAFAYVAVQIAAGCLGAVAAHLMFGLDPVLLSDTARTGFGQWLGEFIATFGLIATILGCLRFSPGALPAAVGLYIGSAYWFTSSTSFANPAVTIARSLSDTFAGIAPADAPGFIVAQLLGAVAASTLFAWLFAVPSGDAKEQPSQKGEREGERSRLQAR
jgi:glycerol uptake facilitator-like aquaporin